MNPWDDGYMLRLAAEALGLPLRTVRSLVDGGHLEALQPFGPYTTRRVPRSELERLEHLGFTVDWEHLDGGNHGKSSEEPEDDLG